MTRIVLDTTVLVSAFFTRHGTSAALLERLRLEDVELVLSPAILEELVRVLHRSRHRRRHPYSDEDIRRFLHGLSRLSVLVNPAPVSGVVRDPADDVILGTAIAAGAPILVTGDQDLLVLGTYEDIEIVTPREFLDRLEAKS